jgi:hypothetical protein
MNATLEISPLEGLVVLNFESLAFQSYEAATADQLCCIASSCRWSVLDHMAFQTPPFTCTVFLLVIFLAFGL